MLPFTRNEDQTQHYWDKINRMVYRKERPKEVYLGEEKRQGIYKKDVFKYSIARQGRES